MNIVTIGFLSTNPTDRITVRQALENPYLSDSPLSPGGQMDLQEFMSVWEEKTLNMEFEKKDASLEYLRRLIIEEVERFNRERRSMVDGSGKVRTEASATTHPVTPPPATTNTTTTTTTTIPNVDHTRRHSHHHSEERKARAARDEYYADGKGHSIRKSIGVSNSSTASTSSNGSSLKGSKDEADYCSNSEAKEGHVRHTSGMKAGPDKVNRLHAYLSGNARGSISSESKK